MPAFFWTLLPKTQSAAPTMKAALSP